MVVHLVGGEIVEIPNTDSSADELVEEIGEVLTGAPKSELHGRRADGGWVMVPGSQISWVEFRET